MIKWRTGCSGFYNKHWKGIFYPETLPQSKWLNFYCEQLNSLELNVTFYRFPTIELMHGWFKKSPEDFIFSVKAPRSITHYKKFVDCRDLLKDFYTVCENGLKNKLGCILFQFPPGFVYDDQKLDLIIKNLNPGFKNVLEFRHSSWWSEKVYNALMENKITFCSVSYPNLPTAIITTTSVAYARLHGIPQLFYSDYSSEKLEEWYSTLVKLKKLKEGYVYFNNTAGIYGITNALTFQKKLKEYEKEFTE